MHELSIALALIDGAISAVESEPGTVRAVHVRVGVLSGVVAEALESAYNLARMGTRLDQASLIVERVPARLRCLGCHTEEEMRTAEWAGCSSCGSTQHQLLGGRDLEIVAVEVEAPHEQHPTCRSTAAHSEAE